MNFPFQGRTLPLPRRTFRALRHRDFRLLWAGLFISLVGGWMQNVARGWLVLRLTDSPFSLGAVGFATFLPILLFGLPAGAVADRVNRRRLLLILQSAAMLLSLILAVLTATDRVTAVHIAAVAFGMGVAGAFDIPTRQSLLKDLVGEEDLPNAIALNSLAFNGARLIGPAIAGALLAVFDEATVFFINAATYVGMLGAVLALRHRDRAQESRASWVADVREALRYAAAEPRTRTILSLVVVSSVFAFPYTVLLPVFARDVLQVGSAGLGWMTSATGVGAIAGALFLAGHARPTHPGRTIGLALAGLGAGLIAFSLTTSWPLSLVLLSLIGFCMLVQVATSNTTLQLLAPEGMRGRVVSLYMLAFLGMSPFGSLLAGWLAHAVGTPRTVTLGGSACVLAAGWFATRVPALRRSIARYAE